MSKSTIVIGAGPGLGSALAARFASGGHDVALIARDRTRLATLKNEIGGEVRAEAYSADALNFDSLRAAVERAIDDLGPPAVLIYNISRWYEARATELSPEALDQDLRLCATSALVSSQAVLPAMQSAGEGAVFWTGGGLALKPETGGPVPSLAAGKSAMRGLALASAADFRKAGVTLSTVTIAGPIQPGTAFDPAKIAQAFWRIYETPPADRPVEEIFRGA